MNKKIFLRLVCLALAFLIFSTSAFLVIGIADADENDCDVTEYLSEIRELRRNYAEAANQQYVDIYAVFAFRYLELIEFRESLFAYPPSELPSCAYMYHGTMIAWVFAEMDMVYYMLLSQSDETYLEAVQIYQERATEITIILGELYKEFDNDGA